MAIVKVKNSRVSKIERDFSDSLSSGDDEFRMKGSVSDEDDDVDSGAGSDDFDESSELGELGTEFCQIGDQNCLIPFELYELPDLTGVLSLETWNNCLTEEERFSLSEYLPDMDQDTFMRTLKELFSGSNFHFGSPLVGLFDRLRGGLCEPRVALYRQGLNFFQKKEHYHLLRKYQNSMVSNLFQIRHAWENCAGYSIEERLRLLNILRSQRVLMYERDEDERKFGLSETESSVREDSSEDLVPSIRSKRPNDRYLSVSWKSGLDNRFGMKMGHNSSSLNAKPAVEVSSLGGPGKLVTVEPAKYGKQNPKGILKVAMKAPSKKGYSEAALVPFSGNHALETKSRPQVSLLTLPRQGGAVGYELVNSRRTRSQIKSEDGEEHAYKPASQMPKVGLSKPPKKHEFVKKHEADSSRKVSNGIAESEWLGRRRLGEDDTESGIGLQLPPRNSNIDSSSRHRKVNERVDVAILTAKSLNNRGYAYRPRDAGNKVKHLDKHKRSIYEEQINPAKDLVRYAGLGTAQGDRDQAFTGARVDWIDGDQTLRRSASVADKKKRQEALVMDDWKFQTNKKWKLGEEVQTFKNKRGSDSKIRSFKSSPVQQSDYEEIAARDPVSYYHSDHRGQSSLEKFKRTSTENGSMNIEEMRGISMISRSEDTYSDSSEGVDEEAEINPSMRKLGYSSGVIGDHRSVSVRSADHKNSNKLARKEKKGYFHDRVGDHGEQSSLPEFGFYSAKRKQKSKRDPKQLTGLSDANYFQDYGSEILEENNLSVSTKLADDRIQRQKSAKKGQMQRDAVEMLHRPLLKTYSSEKKRRGKIDLKYSSEQGKSNYMHDFVVDDDDDDLHVPIKLPDDHPQTDTRSPLFMNEDDHRERSQIPLFGSNSTKKKRKGKADGSEELDYMREHAVTNLPEQTDGIALLKKRGKKKADNETGSLVLLTAEPVISEREMAVPDAETKPLKKLPILIKPSVLTGFSFSIIHLLSAVRTAMITVHPEDTPKVHKHLERNDGKQRSKKEEQKGKHERANGAFQSHSPENRPEMFNGAVDLNSSEHGGENSFTSLPFQEIVNRVRLNPGDPCILETQEPLQDLIRGVLKIFSSKTAPLGAKGWKPLAIYDKAMKSWSWSGPVSSASLDDDAIEEKTSSEAWGVPHKMLVKLVDAFANWLKNGQETLQQIGSLPAPPAMLMLPSLDEKERFRDLRAQKSLTTISPSSNEVRAYFRREEILRYSVPDRAFAYTAADGRKSVVAPLRRCGGKPTSKARDHFMLKPDRPPHVTILCLVRDAAARLPGSIGTRADVCTLIRDSQYIVEDVSDAQVNQVVSGALDRLHYERDPCVQFDGDRKLWVYLHREREEEDFEDDGTSSTKKWKRQKKDGTEPSEPGAVNDAGYHGVGDQVASGSAMGYDFGTDFNAESSSVYSGVKTEPLYGDLRTVMEENVEPYLEIPSSIGLAQGSMHQGHTMGWEVLELNPLCGESNIRCQENAANDDFDDESFNRGRPVGLLNASLV